MPTAIIVGLLAVVSIVAGIFCSEWYQDWRKGSLSGRLTIWTSISLVSVAVLATISAWPESPQPELRQPYEFVLDTESKRAFIYDRKGAKLFVLDAKKGHQWDKILVSELDGDVNAEVVAASHLEEGTTTEALIEVYNRHGELRWSRPLGDPSPWSSVLVALSAEGLEVRKF